MMLFNAVIPLRNQRKELYEVKNNIECVAIGPLIMYSSYFEWIMIFKWKITQQS